MNLKTVSHEASADLSEIRRGSDDQYLLCVCFVVSHIIRGSQLTECDYTRQSPNKSETSSYEIHMRLGSVAGDDMQIDVGCFRHKFMNR